MAAMMAEPAGGRVAPIRILVVAGVAFAAMIGVVAIGLNRLPASQRPALATMLWPTHPDAVRDEAMRDIGLAAAGGADVPAGARRAMLQLAQAEPLRVHPYLVEATVAATAGAGARAERLFATAAKRDPRAPLAHLALADRYLRTNRLTEGLAEISILARLFPGATDSLVGPIAAYARQPGTAPVIKQFFGRSPSLAPLVLAEMAKDPLQADRVIALGEGLAQSDARQWQQQVVQTLVDNRQYARALAAWRKLMGVARFVGIYNPQFAADGAPPPFNWAPFNGSGALAEPAPGGGLKIVYYGREDIVVTRQLLVLDPGRHTLAMQLGDGPMTTAPRPDGAAAEGLSWQVTCADGGAVLDTMPLRRGATGRTALRFVVPATCRAQWLTLRGTAGQFGEPVALTVSALTLRPGPGA